MGGNNKDTLVAGGDDASQNILQGGAGSDVLIASLAGFAQLEYASTWIASIFLSPCPLSVLILVCHLSSVVGERNWIVSIRAAIRMWK